MPLAIARFALTIASAVGLAMRAPSAPAPVDRRPDVVLWPAAQDVASELPDAVDARFELQPRDSLVRALDDARAHELSRRQDALAAIERGLEAAREAFVAQRFDDMVGELETIQRDHLELLAEPANCATLWEVEFRLGLAFQFRGKDGDLDRMREQYGFALELDRERRPVRELYGPDVLAAFLAAVDGRAGRVARPLQIASEPRDAMVHVDCRAIGANRTIDLLPGLHVVHAGGPGLASAAVVVATQTTEIARMQLHAHDGADAITRFGATTTSGTIDPRSATARRALAAATAKWGAEITVLAWSSEGRAAARALVGAASGPVVVRDSFEAAVAAVLAGVDDDGHLRAAPGPIDRSPKPPEPPKRKPVARTWWFWTILGTVTVAAALGLGLGLGLRDRDPNRLVIVGPK